MLTVLLALAPIFLLILLGHGLKRWHFVEDGFWSQADRLTYYVTFPALLVSNLASASLGSLPWPQIVACIGGTTLLLAALILLGGPLLRPTADRAGRATLSSVFQGAIRPNTYVGLAGAAALYGNDGITVTALCIAITVPLVNVLSVTALMLLVPPAGSSQHRIARLRSLALGLLRNPLILSCIGGIVLNVSGLGLPPVIEPVLGILAKASLPMGLLSVGAGLLLTLPANDSTSRWRAVIVPFVAASVGKLVLLPVLVTLTLDLLLPSSLSLSAATLGTMILWSGVPCSASSYILARQMGGDAPMMAALITWQTVLAMISLPALISLLPWLTG